MRTSANYAIKVLTTGFIVLLLSAVILFCGRFITDARLRAGMPRDATRVEISPSGLLPDAVEFDPNADRRSMARASIDDDIQLTELGLVDYVMSMSPGGRRSDVFRYEDEGDWTYFDRATGQIVLRKTDEQAKRVVTCYAGPDGISDAPSSEHGRFIDPVMTRGWRTYFVYDRKLRRFFAIDWRTQSVRAGAPLEDTPAVQPLRIGGLEGGAATGTYVGWQPPTKLWPREREADDSRQQYSSVFTVPFAIGDPGGYIPVVDASGRVDLLDGRTLNLTQGKGFLPAPRTLYGQGLCEPSQLLDYAVGLAGVGEDAEYLGMVVSSVSRQGTSMRLAVYDKSGKLVEQADTVAELYDGAQSPHSVPSAKAALFEVPWGPALAVFKHLLENVHPPVLTLASFFTANAVDAQAGHRALFLLPNSFVAMHRDRVRDGTASQLIAALWTMFPALLLAVFLTWRVVRDAVVVGLSRNARAGWIVATLAAGLPAYITYRLTRPKAALVTCANCGQPRRPDMGRCHRCNSPWHVPELTPPTWTVLDGGARKAEEASALEKESAEPEQKSDSSVESM
jgi:hypothetical protein